MKSGNEPASAGAALPRRDGMRAIFLVGFMGAGKTSVGKVLSRHLGWPFQDLDDHIQAREGRTIEEIFRHCGEAGFRQVESAALRDLIARLDTAPRIVALGGGAFAQSGNAALLRQDGMAVVFLDGSADELYRRCEQHQQIRPMRQDLEQFRVLYEERRKSYLAAAVTINTENKDINTVATEVACRLGLQ